MAKYSKQQYLVSILLIAGNSLCALCYALQAPFFPREAESKGATPSQYGLVFGSFEIVMLFMSPLLGKYISVIGIKFSALAGLFLSAGSMYLFGLLELFNETETFIGFAFAIRIVESLGNCAYFVSFFSYVVMVFPDNPASMFATFESFYGLGMILGPSLGGILYTLGGFSLPFTVMAILLLLTTIFGYFVLPADTDGVVNRATFFSALKVKSIFFIIYAIAINTFALGTIQVGLEPHLRPLGYTPLEVGFIFFTFGLAYSITTPLWGRLMDRYLSPYIAIAIGGVLFTIAYLLLGPAPYIPIEPSLALIIISLILIGLGMGGELVGTYIAAQRDAIAHGMPDNLSTFGIISGLWIASLALGAFLGPSITGYLIEVKGFRVSTQLPLVMHLILVFMFCALEFYHRRQSKKTSYIGLLQEPAEEVLHGSDLAHYGSLGESSASILPKDKRSSI